MVLIVSHTDGSIKFKITKSEMIRSLLNAVGSWIWHDFNNGLPAIEIYKLESSVKFILNNNVEIYILTQDLIYFENWKGEPCNPENS